MKAVVKPSSTRWSPESRSVSPALALSMWHHGRHARDATHKAVRPSKSQPVRQCVSTQARPLERLVPISSNASPTEDCGRAIAAGFVEPRPENVATVICFRVKPPQSRKR